MMTSQRSKVPADAERRLQCAAYAIAHVLSFFSTAFGLTALFGSDSVTRWIISLALSFLLQIVLGWAGYRIFDRRRGWSERLVAAPIFLVCMPLSTGFAFGYWHQVLRANTVAQEVAVARIDGLLTPVIDFQQGLTEASVTLGRLHTYSAERAATERRVGGTCQNIGGGSGPRERLRDADARLFQGLAEDLDRARGAVQAGSDELSRLRDSYEPSNHDEFTAEANRLLRELRPWLSDDRRSAIAQLEGRIEEGRSVLTDERTGELYGCPDPSLEGLMKLAVSTLRSIPRSLPEELAFHRPDNSESVGLAYARLGSLLGLLEDESIPPFAGEDTPPLILAIAIDVISLVMAFVLWGKTDRQGYDYVQKISTVVDEAAAGSPAAAGLLAFALAEPERDLYGLFRPYVVRRRGFEEIVIPVGLPSRETEVITAILDALDQRAYARAQPITEDLRRELPQPHVLAGADRVAVYQLKPGLMPSLARERIRRLQARPPVKDQSGPLSADVQERI